MRLSVIIPTCNRCGRLSRALESISKQTLHPESFEVIVVDNGSTDSTRNIANSFTELIPNLRYYYDESPGLHVGRHKGLKESSSDILVYADDDIEAFPTWLEGIMEAFEDPTVALAGGKILPLYGTAPPQWIDTMWGMETTPYGKVLSCYSLLDFGNDIKEISPLYVWGCNFSIRKEILEEIGGFHPDSLPRRLRRYRGDGETAVSRAVARRGYKALYHPLASVYHYITPEQMTYDYLYQRSFDQGISDSYTLIRKNRGLSCAALMWRFGFHLCHRLLFDLKKRLHLIDKHVHIIRKAHSHGFLFHQKSVWKDKNLLQWVLEKDYFETGDTLNRN